MKREQEVQRKATERAQNMAGLIQPLREAGMSLREIAAELNRADVRMARGSDWQASQVERNIERLEQV
ncbi:hypothetical protein JT55_16515 [Rhodovulum sp. NI22]|nr:hypothetical protein JT55_16515 [Rhodovulum sp. NI22]